MRNVSIVKDKVDGTPFAVIVIDKAKKINAFGSKGQGETWAEWVNASEMSFDDAVDSLDISLIAGKPLPASSANTEELAKFMRPEEVLELQSEISKKSILEVIEIKSLDPVQNDDEEEVPDFTPVSEWPITDVEIAAIDVLYKQNAVDYKAKAFIAEKNISSLMYEVKGYRAIWDPNISSWRCPEDTVNGGQFTNRMGRGCTTGMVRRLGQFLMSLEDRNAIQPKLPGIDEPRTALYRAGKIIDSRAEASREKFVGKMKNRAARRRQRANLNPRFTDLYGALNPDKPALARARTAAGLRLQRMGGNIAQGGFAQMDEAGRRKQRRLRKAAEQKFPGGAKGKKLREEGGIIPNSRLSGYVVPQYGEPPLIIDLNEMIKNSSYLKNAETIFDESGKEIPNPIKGFNYITRREAAEIINQHQAGIIKRTLASPDKARLELKTFEDEIRQLLIMSAQNSWEDISTGNAYFNSYYSDAKFLDYDELQIEKAKYAKDSRHSASKRLSQTLQSFDGLEKLDESDPRIADFKARIKETNSAPFTKPDSVADIRFEGDARDSGFAQYVEATTPGRPPVHAQVNQSTAEIVRRKNLLSLDDMRMDVATVQVDHHDDSGNYLFTVVYSSPKGGSTEDITEEFYVEASKPSRSITEIEAKKSRKNGEISSHFRIHGGKNPLTDRGGFISAYSVHDTHSVVDLDAMIPLNAAPGIIGGDAPLDVSSEIIDEIAEWRKNGWRYVSRDEWHEMETRVLAKAGYSRDTLLPKKRNSTLLKGLGGDSPLLKMTHLERFEDADVEPESFVRAFSSKDLKHMRNTRDLLTMSHLNDDVWKKAIRRKEKSTGRDMWGDDVDSQESRLNRIRQNLATFIASFDPLADEETKNRRTERKARKKTEKADASAPEAANANNLFGKVGEEGKLNIRQLLDWNRQTMSNFRSDIAARGVYTGNNQSYEAVFADANQTAGKPSAWYERIKSLVDEILEENGVFGADPSSVQNNSIPSFTSRLMEEAANFASNNDYDAPYWPVISYTNFRIIEKTDGAGTKKIALRELMTVTPYVLDHSDSSKNETGIFTIGIHTTEINDLTDDEIDGIESGRISFDELRDRFTNSAGGNRASSPVRRGFPDDETEINIVFDRAGDALVIDGDRRTKIPYRGSRNEKIDVTTGGVSGKITTPKGAELNKEDEDADIGEEPSFWNSGKKGKKRRPSARETRGQSPKTPGVIERFLTGEGRRWMRERDAAERLQQGRMPRSTDSIRERFFKRLSQMSNRMRGEADPIEIYPVIPSRVIGQDLRTRYDGPNAIWGSWNELRVLDPLRGFPIPPNQNAGDWKSNSDNVRRITDLSDSLESLGGWRPRITQEDRDREAELLEMYNEWKDDFNNPNQPNLPGSTSNFGYAIVAEDSNPNYSRIAIYDMRQEHYPPVAIIDARTGTSHLLDKDGKHLMSIVETQDVNGNNIIVPIIGPSARRQFEERERIPGFIERMTGKFRKRKPRQVNTPTGSPQRLAKRGVVRSKSGRSGIFYPQRTKGDYIQSLDALTDSQIKLLSNAVSSKLEALEKEFRKHLNLSETDELLEDDILDHIDDLAKAGNGRLSGVRKSALHDMLVLMDAKDSGDLMLINDLKPSRRNSIISSAGIMTGVDVNKNRPFTPYGPTRPSDSATTITPTSTGTTRQVPPRNLDQTATPNAPRAPRTITGPALTPGIGNPALNISFRNGVYVDDNTGELVEDLSGLDVSPDMVYVPHSVDTDGYFPSIPVPGSIQGIKPQRVIKIAPGVDPNHPDIANSKDPRLAVQVDSVPQTFDEASQIAEDARMLVHPSLQMAFAGDLSSYGFILHHNSDSAYVTSAMRKAAEENGLYKDSQILGPISGDAMNKLTAMGIDGPGPAVDAYLPGPAVDDASRDQLEMAKIINRALQAEHVASEMERMSNNVAQTTWNQLWGSGGVANGFRGASPDLDITPDNVAKARERADAAWAKAATDLAAMQQSHTLKSNTALQTIRLTSRPGAAFDRAQFSLYLRHGQVAEMAEHLIRKHIISDPSVMESLANIKRQQMENAAKRTNARMRARANRAAAGRRNVGQLDDAIDPATGNPVLDIHGNGQVSNSPQRTVQEIMDIHAEHRADGALEPPTVDPATGISQDGILDDDDIEMLSAMGRAHTDFSSGNRQVAGHPDLVGTEFYDIGAMMMGSWWQYSGYSSLPLLLDEKEIASLLDDVGPDGIPNAIAITRGIKDINNIPAGDLIEQNLRGDRFVVGQGASASGRGEYWTGEPTSWSSWHAPSRGSQIGILTRDSKIMTTDVADALFTGSGGGFGDSLLYGALWSLANAHGAPDFGGGVNVSHGNVRTFGVPENSLLPDPNTGLYDIPALQSVVDKMTDLTPGQEGIATLEGWNNSNNMPSWLAAELFPGAGASREIVEEAQEQRQQWNAWLSQHLSWFVQIAQMARDESQPGQAGIDAKEWNKKLNEARRTLLYMSRENRLALMGYDAILAGSRTPLHQKALPSKIWTDPSDGIGTKKRPNVILILNRSAGMYYRIPTEWRAFKDRLNNSLTNAIPW
jgi:hypothetical protein